MTQLEIVCEEILKAKVPKDLFMDLPPTKPRALATLDDVWKVLVRKVHPDTAPAKKKDLANKATARLNELKTLAEDLIASGRYDAGTRTPDCQVVVKGQAYTVKAALTAGDICDLYRVEWQDVGGLHRGVLKVARDVRDNDLVSNEAVVYVPAPCTCGVIQTEEWAWKWDVGEARLQLLTKYVRPHLGLYATRGTVKRKSKKDLPTLIRFVHRPLNFDAALEFGEVDDLGSLSVLADALLEAGHPLGKRIALAIHKFHREFAA